MLTGLLALGACVGLGPETATFRHGVGLPPEVVRDWTVAAVEVTVPADLTVSEDPGIRFPGTDIVWWEDPPGDRRAQVAAVIRTGALAAVEDLKGPEAVTLRLTVRRFHALTPAALASGRRGWHDVTFDIAVTGADGRVLAAEDGVRADIRALQGTAAEAARLRGETQAGRIAGRVEGVLRAWLGTLPAPAEIRLRRGAIPRM